MLRKRRVRGQLETLVTSPASEGPVTDLFRGFVRTKNKKSIMAFKDNDDLLSLEQVRSSDEYAGILADGVILVDVDDAGLSDIVLRIVDALELSCCVVDTTRGKHFLFRATDAVTTCKTKTQTAIGIQLDMKLGSRNSYEILKKGGVERPWIRRPDNLDLLPPWLLPVKHNVDFVTMAAGDGRNQAFFNYILTLQSAGMEKSDIIDTITLINTHVLPDPLEQSELDVILRDDSFKKVVFFRRGEFQHHEFAKFLLNNEHVVKINNTLHVYRDGVYSGRQTDIEAAMLRHLPQLTQTRRREVLSYLDIVSPEVEQSPVTLIALSGGVYDLETDEVLPNSPDIVIRNRVPVAYDQDAYDETTDNVLTKICCGDLELRSLVEEVVGYIFLRRNELGKTFIFSGAGSNGKSTLLDMLKYLLGQENYSSLALDELGNRFKTAEIVGKLANLGDDISNQYIDNNAVFKKLVTGETVNVERKGKDPFDFNNYAKMLFSANQLPRINDTTDGLMRRLVIIPFNAKFSSTDDDFDPFIKDKLLTLGAMQYLLKLGLVGLKRVLKRKKFTDPEVVKQELLEYERLNNPILAFVDEGHKIENETSSDVYLKYNAWCHSNGLRPWSQIQFSRELCKRGFENRVKKIEGKSCRVFNKV